MYLARCGTLNFQESVHARIVCDVLPQRGNTRDNPLPTKFFGSPHPIRRYGMSIKINAPLVDGSLWDPFERASGEDVVKLICGDDLRPPPTSVVISVTTASGKVVEIRIPNSGSGTASVRIDGEWV